MHGDLELLCNRWTLFCLDATKTASILFGKFVQNLFLEKKKQMETKEKKFVEWKTIPCSTQHKVLPNRHKNAQHKKKKIQKAL